MNLAPQIGKTYGDEAAAGLMGAKNLLGLGLGIASLPLGSIGGGALSSLGSGNAFMPSSSFMNNSWGW